MERCDAAPAFATRTAIRGDEPLWTLRRPVNRQRGRLWLASAHGGKESDTVAVGQRRAPVVENPSVDDHKVDVA